MTKCRLCSEEVYEPIFSGILLGRLVNYFDCKVCGYVQTEDPTWLSEAYATKMNDSDTGVMQRNISNASLALATLVMMRKRKSIVVDYAAGYGFLVRLLRDRGINAFYSDPYSQNLVAKGFEYLASDNLQRVDLVMAFEAFEHFINPLEEMKKIISISSNILLSTAIIDTPAPKPSNWWYYGPEHGQHIGFYRLKTLNYLAKRFNLNLISDGKMTHFFSNKKYSKHLWKLLIFFSVKFPRLFAIGLKSKIWTDHLKISKT
jgi:hypothetical protein